MAVLRKRKWRKGHEKCAIGDQPIPEKIFQRGGYKGWGVNQKLLARLTPSDLRSCIYKCSKKKMSSIRQTAWKYDILITIRQHEDGRFSIWRRT